MNLGVKIGLAALGGAAIGTAAGLVAEDPRPSTGGALIGAGAGTLAMTSLWGRGSVGQGLFGVGLGALLAGLGVTTLFRADNPAPVKHQYNPVDHPIELPTPTRTTLPEPAWQRADYDPLRTPSPSPGPAPQPVTGTTTGG